MQRDSETSDFSCGGEKERYGKLENTGLGFLNCRCAHRAPLRTRVSVDLNVLLGKNDRTEQDSE